MGDVTLNAAVDAWRNGDTPRAAELLAARVPQREQPRWAVAVLDACSARIPTTIPAEVRLVREIAATPARWPEAHDAFRGVRLLLLSVWRGPPLAHTEEEGLFWLFLALAENVAKVTYNASNSSAPFDSDVDRRVATCARWLSDWVHDADFEASVWFALTNAIPA
jgi:hypothetical protein